MKSNTALGNAMILKAKALLGISLENQEGQQRIDKTRARPKSSNLLKRTKSSDFIRQGHESKAGPLELKKNLENFQPSLRQKREVLNDAELIWQQKLAKLQRKFDKSQLEYLKLSEKYANLENVKNDLQNALALNSTQIIRIRRLEAKEELLNKNLDFFKDNVTLLLDTLSNLKEFHLDTEGQLKHSYNKRVDLIQELNALNLDTFKSQFNAFFSELVSIDNLKQFNQGSSSLKNDLVF